MAYVSEKKKSKQNGHFNGLILQKNTGNLEDISCIGNFITE